MKKLAIFAAVMVVGCGVAFAATLNIPFFRDNSTNLTSGIAGVITVKEASNNPRTITVVYTALNASDNPTNQTVTFALGANQVIAWNPVQNTVGLPGGESAGSIVGNMTIQNSAGGTRTVGSASVIAAGAIAGSYQEINFTRSSDMGINLIEP